MIKKLLLYSPHLSLISFTITALVHMFQFYDLFPVGAEFATVTRVIFIFFLIMYGFRKKSLTTWILISMVLGGEFGHDFPEIAVHLQVVSQVFLRMIKTIIAPLLFATLVVGIAGHSNLKQLGRLGWKSLLYFEVVSTIALFIGLFAINVSQAGVGVPAMSTTHATLEAKKQTWEEIILHIFPENIAKAIYEGQVLQIVVFSIIFGIALVLVAEKFRKPLLTLAESLAETMFKFTNIVMIFAPLAVGGAIAYTIGHMGLGILVNLFKLLLTLYAALIIFIIMVLIPIMLVMKIPVVNFFKAVFGPASLAFATTSSEAALPKAMEAMEKFGVPRKIISFVIPTGYSFNLDGTTLYLSLATIFVAQVAGVHLSLGDQILICLTLMVTSKGVAGVPRASLVILLGTAASFGLPIEPIFIILGIDELMDMARTTVNVIGNCLASAVIAKWENDFDQQAALNYGKLPVETVVIAER